MPKYKEKIDLLQGTLDMLILKTLTRGQMHGYEIARWIQQTSEDALQVEEGSLYPALYRMERRGWIASRWGQSENNRKARFYSLTPVGRKQLESESVDWGKLTRAISKIMQTA
jgi:PadR family transcriptional regulator